MFGGWGDDGAPGVDMQKRNHEHFANALLRAVENGGGGRAKMVALVRGKNSEG